MNYYEHHINDYAEATSHLTFVEESAYARCIRKYYAKESPLPVDIKAVQRLVGCRTPEERAAVETVLREFFVLMPDGWRQEKCDEVIAHYQAGEPEREERRQSKQQHHETRLHRHRDERAKLFAALADAGHRPPWNTKMKTLRELFATYCTGRAASPATPAETKPATASATLPDTPATATATASNAPRTASQFPVPNTQYPSVAGSGFGRIENTSGAALPNVPATPETRCAADFSMPVAQTGQSTPTSNGEKPRVADPAPETPETLQVDQNPLQQQPGPTPTPAGAMATALRNARVSVTSLDPTLLAWISDGIITEQLLEAVSVARLRRDKAEGAIPAKYLDPIVREMRAKAAAPAPTKRQETPGEREWRLLRSEASGCGYHREPRPEETAAQYREALKEYEREQAARAMQRINDGLAVMKAVPK